MVSDKIFFWLGCVFGAAMSLLFTWLLTADLYFTRGYAQAIIDDELGNSPLYKRRYNGDGTVSWVLCEERVNKNNVSREK